MTIVEKNSEILFLYDAKKCNPNGDMDNENKPRMDWDTNTNLVSDVRLKRYIRDYLKKYKNENIFVTKLGDSALRAEQALQLNVALMNGKKEEELKVGDLRKYESEAKKGKVVFSLIDIRMFGATIPFQVETGKGTSQTLTGPIQFNWGYSLNKVDLQESKTITSHLSTSDSEEGAGVGKDYRVNYSFIAFHGAINAKIAETTKLTEEDIKLFDEAMVKSIPANRTRSKIGQTPRLYMRIQMKDSNSFLKDLREYLKIKTEKEPIRDIEDFLVNFSGLYTYLQENKEKIEKIFYFMDSKMQAENLDKILSEFPTKKLI